MTPSHATEVWRPIPSWPGYWVSDRGQVASMVNTWGKEVPGRWRVLKARANRRGYVWVALCRRQRKFTALVHRLVLAAFVGPCPEGMEACHEDGRPDNNVLGNLRWDTHSGNLADRERHGTRRRGAAVAWAKLTNGQVTEARALRLAGASLGEVAARFRIGLSTAGKVCRGVSYADVPGGVSFARSPCAAKALTEAEVREMRRLRVAGAKLTNLAARFGIHKMTVSTICRGKSWAHVQG